MTSSLVGSEMCIRDSFFVPSDPASVWKFSSHAIQLSQQSGQLLLLLLPVSYTHLTLPTICSV
eukprot:11140429-Prorocentrum_lima.AAC.1